MLQCLDNKVNMVKYQIVYGLAEHGAVMCSSVVMFSYLEGHIQCKESFLCLFFIND